MYKKIQQWIREKNGWVPKTCWIAHCRRLKGLPTRDAPNRSSTPTECPADKREAIFAAFRHFEMI